MTAADIKEIIWTEQELENTQEWEHNLEIVRWLCLNGKITKWLKGHEGKDTYINFPYHYKVEDVLVEFLPHWGFLKINHKSLEIPKTTEDLQTIIRAIILLKELQE